MDNQQQNNVEFRIMPSGDGAWYWEVITQRTTIVSRGVADNQPAASSQASDAARKAELIR